MKLKSTTAKVRIGAYEGPSGQYKGTVVIRAENECPRVHIVNQAITYEIYGKKPEFHFDEFRGLSYEKRCVEIVLSKLTERWDKIFSSLKDTDSLWTVPLIDSNEFYNKYEPEGKIGNISINIKPEEYMPEGWIESLQSGNVPNCFEEACNVPKPDELYEAVEGRAVIEDAINTLETKLPRYAKVVRMRFGLGENYGKEMTLEEIGNEHKVGRERIRMIEAKALRLLRNWYIRRGIIKK